MADLNAHRDWLPPLSEPIPVTTTVEAKAREDVAGEPDTWELIELARDRRACMPGLTLCSDTECVDSWLNDYYLRVLDRGVVVWTSPDAPEADTSGTSDTPADGAVVIAFPRR